MEELVKMSQNKDFLVLDIVLASVKLITSSKKRADLRSVTISLFAAYEMDESHCETLLDTLVLERKLLKIKGKTKDFYEEAGYKNFTITVLDSDGMVTAHAEKCHASIGGDDLWYENLEKFLLESGEYKDAEEIKFALFEDIIDNKVELKNDDEEDFWAKESDNVGDPVLEGSEKGSSVEKVEEMQVDEMPPPPLPQEGIKLEFEIIEPMPPVEEIADPPQSPRATEPSSDLGFVDYESDPGFNLNKVKIEPISSEAEVEKSSEITVYDYANVEVKDEHCKDAEEPAKANCEAEDVQVSAEDAQVSAEDVQVSADVQVIAEDVQVGAEDVEVSAEDVHVSADAEVSADVQVRAEDIEVSVEDVQVGAEDVQVNVKDVQVTADVQVSAEPAPEEVKVKEEPTSDDDVPLASRSSRSRQRSRGFSNLPPKKSSRISSKKFDDDYYFPSLKRRTITRRKKTGSPEPAEEKKEPPVKKQRSQARNSGMKCPICKTACKINDAPIFCTVCNVAGHPACVEQEQMLYLNIDEFDRKNWTCEDCRTDEKPSKSSNREDSSKKPTQSIPNCASCGVSAKVPIVIAGSWECNRCSTKEGTDKIGVQDQATMRSDMVVIHGLKSTTPVNLIWNEIAKRGFQPTKVVNALSKNKDSLDIFFVIIPNLSTDSKIYSITRLFNRDVKILRPFQLKKKKSSKLGEPDPGENEPVIPVLPSLTIEKRKRKSEKNEETKSPKAEIAQKAIPCPTPVELEIENLPNEMCNETKSENLTPNSPKPEIAEADSSAKDSGSSSETPKEERSLILVPGRREWKFPPRWVNHLNRPVPDPEVPNCMSWTTEQVADYFATYFNDEVSKKFIEHDIDGYALKLLTRKNVLVEFGLPISLALSVLFHVKRLQIRTNDRSLIYMDET